MRRRGDKENRNGEEDERELDVKRWDKEGLEHEGQVLVHIPVADINASIYIREAKMVKDVSRPKKTTKTGHTSREDL